MHRCSVFNNSCLNVPVDPFSKMPKTVNERTEKAILDQCCVDSSTTCSVSGNDVDAEKLKEFYRSIPDYSDINHLTETEFYFTLKRLREKKKLMLSVVIGHNNDCIPFESQIISNIDDEFLKLKSDNYNSKKSSRNDENSLKNNKKLDVEKQVNITTPVLKNDRGSSQNRNDCQNTINFNNINYEEDAKNKTLCIKSISKIERPKRNHSACSISWQDDNKIVSKNEIDKKFERFFEDDINLKDNKTYKTRSMPSSPLRTRKFNSSIRKVNLTIPKPFKMTERDEENRMVNELRGLQRSFSEDMLNQKRNKKQFRANPVPIESRIPLYDKILEDQAMRRAITKINSEAELRAQMKPFNFTKREESGGEMCSRALNVLPKPKKKKRFRARPVPKNLFSNYFYDKMKEENFFRSLNRRIRAEEMLRNSSCPGATGRDLSRISTPAAHSDLPTDPSPAALSNSSLHKYRSSSPIKSKKTPKQWKDDLITTSPQPFHFNTAERANKKMTQLTRKMNEDILSTSSIKNNEGISETTRAYSALDLKGISAGRSNLAALLRAEAVKRKFELETARRLAEQRRWAETRQRDRMLRSKPAWHLVKNNHEEDIAMRLQTRRDEERMRREEYFHEMELMYGRVQRQPMLFERYYAPRSDVSPIDTFQRSPRKLFIKRRNKQKKRSYTCSPSRSPEFTEESLKYKTYYDAEDLTLERG